MNKDPDYSAAYIILQTNVPNLEGHGLTFTIGRGNEICCMALEALVPLILNKDLRDITEDWGKFWKYVTGDSQLRWLGPDKGAVHLATGAIVNALWDLYAKAENKPLWRLLADLSPSQLVKCIDFTYLSDVLQPNEALQILEKLESTKAERIQHLEENGYPAYTTSAGWLGYPDEKIRHLCREAIKEGWTHIKMKVGSDIEDDMRRAAIIREEIGYDRQLMMDANQKWEVDESITYIKRLAIYKPLWIEEPTSPDDILGHAKIKEAIAPIKVATGEHCQNRVMFKQFISAGALDICQIDSCRVGGLNENLAIMLIAAKYNIPVCPHAGGVGLCEYVQHLSYLDFISISGDMNGRMIEYVDHLHDHFKDPVNVKNGKYWVPELPGFSIEMKEATLKDFEFVSGSVWNKLKNENPIPVVMK